MNIGLDNSHIANAIRPLERAGWRVTMHADKDHAFLTVHDRLDAAMITIRNEQEACLYVPPSERQGILFVGDNAITEAVARALAAIG